MTYVFVGSSFSAIRPAVAVPAYPRLLLPYEGTPSTTAVPGYAYPFTCDDSEMVRLFRGVWQYAAAWSYAYEGTIDGHPATVTGGGSSVIETQLAGTEAALMLQSPGLGAQDGFRGTADPLAHPFSETETIDGGPPTITQGSAPAELFLCALQGDGFTTVTDTHFYRTDTKRWLPRIDLRLGAASNNFAGGCTASSRPVVGAERMDTFTGTFHGPTRWTREAGNLPSIAHDMEVHFFTRDTLNLIMASFTVTPRRYFAHATAAGAIYDTETGAVLPGRSPLDAYTQFAK